MVAPPHLTARYEFADRRGQTAQINVWPWEKERKEEYYDSVRVRGKKNIYTGVAWRAP